MGKQFNLINALILGQSEFTLFKATFADSIISCTEKSPQNIVDIYLFSGGMWLFLELRNKG